MFVCFLLSICPIFNRFSYLSAYLNRFHVVSPVPACWHQARGVTRHGVTRPGQHVVTPGACWHHMLPRCASVHPQLWYDSDTVTQWLMLKILVSEYNEHSDSDTVTFYWPHNVFSFSCLIFFTSFSFSDDKCSPICSIHPHPPHPPLSMKAYCIRCLKLFFFTEKKHGWI